eukprot:tig00000093_g3472.t1
MSDAASGSNSFVSYEETADIISELLEVAVHQVLWVRKVYPRSLFERRRKYGMAVWMSRHPDVNDYILSAVTSFNEWTRQRMLERIDVVIIGASSAPLERFVFEFTPLQDGTQSLSLSEMETLMRSFLQKIQLGTGDLRDLPDDCSFRIVARTRRDYAGEAWLPAEGELLGPPQGGVMRPLRSASTGLARLQLWVEEPGAAASGATG